jgi:hypothetical protein
VHDLDFDIECIIMSDPPSYDNDLLRRLNALKKSNISLDEKKYILLIYLKPHLRLPTDLSQADLISNQKGGNPGHRPIIKTEAAPWRWKLSKSIPEPTAQICRVEAH